MPKGDNITTKFKVDISDLKAGITEANKQIKLANAEFKAASAGLKDWEKNANAVEAKLKQLNSTLQAQTQKLNAYKEQLSRQQQAYAENGKKAEELKAKLKELADNGIAKTSEEYKKYQQALSDVEKEQNANKTAIDNLKVTILNQEAAVKSTAAEVANYEEQLEELEKGEKDAGKGAEEASEGFTVLKGVISNLATEAINMAIDGLKRLGEAVIEVGKQAVQGYAEQEQLIGGVETLFGTGGQSVEDYAKSVGKSVDEVSGEYKKLENAQNTVIENANNAYKTAGMSANEYMETVTSFSASLINSLDGDTETAAKLADQAIVDMSDNANKMGTDIASLQNAYAGFAKGNYTMLDNLKLGFSGSKEGMQELITKANELKQANGEAADLSIESFADITEAIHLVQEEMGIAGTTAKEAATTIEGSANAMSAAWNNLLVGMATDGANVDMLINNVVDAALTYLDNLIPVAEQVVTTMTEVLRDKLPAALAQIADSLGSDVFSRWGEMGGELVAALISAVMQALPYVADALVGLVTGAVNSVSSQLPSIVPALIKTFSNLIIGALNGLATIVPNLLQGIIDTLPTAIYTLLVQALPEIIQVLFVLAQYLVQSMPQIINSLVEQLPEIISFIVDNLLSLSDMLFEGAVELFNAIVEAIPQFLPQLLAALPDIITTLIDGLTQYASLLIDGAVQLLNAIIEAIPVFLPILIDALPGLVEAIGGALIDNLPLLLSSAVQLLMAIIEAIPTIIIEIGKEVPHIISAILEALGSLGEDLKGLFSEGWEKVKEVFANVGDFFSEKFGDAWEKIKEKFSGFGDFFGNLWEDVKTKFSELGTKISDAISGAVKAGINGVISRIESIINGAIGIINGAIGLINKIPGVSVGTLSDVSFPRLQQGGILKKGQIGFLEGTGAEAVVPLDKNKAWIKAVASDLLTELSGAAAGNINTITNNNKTSNFTQIINAPKTPTRIELYRQTKNLFDYAAATGVI